MQYLKNYNTIVFKKCVGFMRASEYRYIQTSTGISDYYSSNDVCFINLSVINNGTCASIERFCFGFFIPIENFLEEKEITHVFPLPVGFD